MTISPYRVLFSGLALLVLLVSAPTAHAQTTEGVQVKPAVVEDSIQPGQTYHFTIKVTNLATQDKVFFLGAQNIKGLDDDGTPVFADPEEATKFDLSEWVQLPSDSIALKANETKDVAFTVRVPSDASPGSHFGGIFFDQKPIKQQTTGTGVGIKVGTILSLRIAGDILEEARLREFSSDKLIYNEAKVRFTERVEDLGNVLIRPHGLIEISDMFGKSIAQIRVNDAGSPVFPGEDRTYATAWEYDGFAFGRYQAVVSLSYGDEEKKTISGTTSFWILPLKPILTGLGIVLALVIALYLLMRMYIRRQLRDMGVSSGKRADVDMYGRRANRSSSRLIMAVIGIFLVCIVILGVLFLMFA
jgi:hypothetical protein